MEREAYRDLASPDVSRSLTGSCGEKGGYVIQQYKPWPRAQAVKRGFVFVCFYTSNAFSGSGMCTSKNTRDLVYFVVGRPGRTHVAGAGEHVSTATPKCRVTCTSLEYIA